MVASVWQLLFVLFEIYVGFFSFFLFSFCFVLNILSVSFLHISVALWGNTWELSGHHVPRLTRHSPGLDGNGRSFWTLFDVVFFLADRETERRLRHSLFSGRVVGRGRSHIFAVGFCSPGNPSAAFYFVFLSFIFFSPFPCHISPAVGW